MTVPARTKAPEPDAADIAAEPGRQPRTVVIVGGVAAGMSAATRLRRMDEFAHIIVFERGEQVSFANCGLPYHVGGVIEERGALLLQTPASLRQRFELDVRVRHEVVAIRPEDHQVDVLRPDGERFAQSYDALVIATGAGPIRPAIPGIERAFVLRDVADLDRIMTAMASGPRTAVVLGGGFIGLELAENLARRGLSVSVVEATDQLLPPLDPEMAGAVVDELRRHDVAVYLGQPATSVGADAVLVGAQGEETKVPADLVVAAVGVRPASELAADAGIELGVRGAIVVDDRHRTSAADVYAVGDVAVKRDAIDGGQAFVPLAQTANRHGRAVADAICGRAIERGNVLGTAIVQVFDLTIAATGWNEKRARSRGRPIRVIHTHPVSHAGYYPGAAGMSLKLVVDRETDAILGAQAVGSDGVDKRIDVIATAMFAGLRAAQLADLELAYAPQFGSAKDPVNLLGYIADNHASGAIASMQWHEMAAAQAGGAVVLDVRTAGEHAAGAIPGSINVPLDELRDRLGEIPDGPVVVYCQVGQRGNTATRILTQHGRDAVNLDGGYRTWRASPAGSR